MILDTNYVGSLVERDTGAVSLSEEVDESADPVRLPTAVVWELFYGLGKLADVEYATLLRRKYASIIGGTTAVDVDNRTARRAGTLRGRHAASDTLSELDGADSIVAAHGLILNEPVVSNDADFQDVDGLAVTTY